VKFFGRPNAAFFAKNDDQRQWKQDVRLGLTARSPVRTLLPSRITQALRLGSIEGTETERRGPTHRAKYFDSRRPLTEERIYSTWTHSGSKPPLIHSRHELNPLDCNHYCEAIGLHDRFLRSSIPAQYQIAKDMKADKGEFLQLLNLPARLTITEVAWFLGFTETDISVLISVGLLKPLGHPPASGSKYFALTDLQALRTDARWLAKASDATVNYWKRKNASRVGNRPAITTNPGG